MRASKIGRNQPCPCGAKKKYKNCCLGKTDWEKMLSEPLQVQSRHLSLRGKNNVFINSIASALQLDSVTGSMEFKDVKQAFSPRAVQEIFASIPEVWPDFEDYERCIEAEAGTVTALYVGHYEPEFVLKAITRLSLYCDRIYLVDPFVNVKHMRDEYNPLLHPEEHRATAIKFSFLWMSLAPWIDAGIVYFIRPLHDFIPGLLHEVLNLERRRFDENPKLRAIRDEEVTAEVKRMRPTDRGEGEIFMLMYPDESLREFYRKMLKERPSVAPFPSEDEFIAYIQKRRDQHPYYVERLPGQTSELHQSSSGASYELAKRMCALTNSHIVTSIRTRWKEVELDREVAGIDLQGWSPFAKALQESDCKLLNNVPINAALRLREEERLQSLRLFFRKVWKNCGDPDNFSEANAINLSGELRDEVARANEEWRAIDYELLKMLGPAWGAAIVASGNVGFVPAAAGAAVAGITGLIQARMKRSTFKERYPAGFFLGLKDNSEA